MTKEEAEFERHMSRSILEEIAKMLGLGQVKYYENDPPSPVYDHDHPFIYRCYGERLTVPQDGGWHMVVTVSLWLGVFKVDIGQARFDSGICFKHDHELEYDAADPKLIEKIVAKYTEIQKGNPP